MTSKTWLVTGASSGLGTAIAEVALRAGQKVIATARNPTKAAAENPQIEELGGTWIELDVTRSDTAQQVENAIRQTGGAVDVVVNNAGYSLLGSIEDMSEEEIETQFSTNVFGPVRVLKGVLPFMRAQRSGTVVNVTSIAGMDGGPSCAMYAGSKFALEGMGVVLILTAFTLTGYRHVGKPGKRVTAIRHQSLDCRAGTFQNQVPLCFRGACCWIEEGLYRNTCRCCFAGVQVQKWDSGR